MNNPNNKLLIRLLLFAALSTALLMASFEIVKQLIHANITIWQSHLTTIVFTTLAAVFIIYLALRKHYSLLRILSGFIPICSYYKKIRDEKGDWVSFEAYIGERSHAEFTHSACSECSGKVLEELKKMKPPN